MFPPDAIVGEDNVIGAWVSELSQLTEELTPLYN